MLCNGSSTGSYVGNFCIGYLRLRRIGVNYKTERCGLRKILLRLQLMVELSIIVTRGQVTLNQGAF